MSWHGLNVWFGCCLLAAVDLAGFTLLMIRTRGWRGAYLLGILGFVSAWGVAVPLPLLIMAARTGMLGV